MYVSILSDICECDQLVWTVFSTIPNYLYLKIKFLDTVGHDFEEKH